MLKFTSSFTATASNWSFPDSALAVGPSVDLSAETMGFAVKQAVFGTIDCWSSFFVQ